MRILFVIIFTTFPHRGCNFTLLRIYSNLLLLAQGHFHNYICQRFHIGQSEVIFFFLCSHVCKAEHAGAASCFTFGDLESVFFLTGVLPLTAPETRNPKPLGTWDKSGPGAGEKQVSTPSTETAIPKRRECGTDVQFCGDVSFVVVMRWRQ